MSDEMGVDMTDRGVIEPGDVQIAITLASLTYLAENDTPEDIGLLISSHLEQADLPTANSWRVVWGPAVHGPNMCFIARGPNSAGPATLALVIRGTNMTSVESLKQDAELQLVPLPFTGPGIPANVRISRGFSDAYVHLTHATDARGETAFEYLARTLESDTVLDVVGHSLGGAMAPIVAVALKPFFARTTVRCFSFGGQSPGNAAFARHFRTAFPDQPSRWIVDIDIIPMWYGGLDEMMTLFGPSGPPCPVWVKALVLSVENRHEYEALPSPHRYTGVLYPLVTSWETQASNQHNHFYYMYLTGIPVAAIRSRLGPAWSPPYPSS